MIFSPLNNIINYLLQDISNTMSNCAEQIQTTHKNIEEIEYLIQTQQSDTSLRSLIQKNNQLLLDNFCLISEQTQLVEYYQKLVVIMGKRNRNTIDANSNHVLYDLLEYYKEHNQHKNVTILDDYLKRMTV